MGSKFVAKLSAVIVGATVALVGTAFADKDYSEMTPEEQARSDAFMERMAGSQSGMDLLESTLLSQQDDVGREVGALLAEKVGADKNLVEGREAEFGRAITNLVRTFQMGGGGGSYAHQANDALVKQHLEWLQFAKDKGLLAEAIEHDINIKAPLFKRSAEWIKRTGNYKVALNTLTGASCFRDLAAADGFVKTDTTMTWTSPYKHVLDAGKKRNMFDLTEKEIHEQFTIPTIKGYAEVIGVEVSISEWDEETRLITISVEGPIS